MKVRIGREELLTGLQRVQGVVEKRNTMPILSNILLEAKHDGAGNRRHGFGTRHAGLYKASVLEAGGVTISARKLYEIIKELPSGEIELTSGITIGPRSSRARASSRSSACRAVIIPRCHPLNAKG